jgi:hypothetical protein
MKTTSRKPKRPAKAKTSRTAKRKGDSRAAHGSAYWPLFKHMSDNHGLTLLDSEMEDICRVVLQMRVPTNWCDNLLTGPNRALTGDAGKWGCSDIENLLNAIRTGKTPNAELRRTADNTQRKETE